MSRVLCFKLYGLQQTYIELHRRMCTLPDRLDRSTTRLADRPILHLFLDTAPRHLLHGSRALSSVWTTRLLCLLGVNRKSELSRTICGRGDRCRTSIDLHIRQVLPLVHGDNPFVISPSTAERHRRRCQQTSRRLGFSDRRAHLTSTTSWSLPMSFSRSSNLCMSNLAEGNSQDVTITCIIYKG